MSTQWDMSVKVGSYKGPKWEIFTSHMHMHADTIKGVMTVNS